MGWNCPGGVRQKGNVLREEEKREKKKQQPNNKWPTFAVSNRMETIGDDLKGCNSKGILENLGATETRKTVFDKVFLMGPIKSPMIFRPFQIKQ